MRTNKKRLTFVLMAVVLLLCAICAGMELQIEKEGAIASATSSVISTATADAEVQLAERYGVEISDLIETFDVQWHSFERLKDCDANSTLVTEQFLDTGGGLCLSRWLVGPAAYSTITKSAAVRQMRVLEYAPDRFKALVTLDRVMQKVNVVTGAAVEPTTTDVNCGIYIFIREDDVWKLDFFFWTHDFQVARDTIIREWSFATEEVGEDIGELPDGDLCEW
ncbi:MAG: hypothetical protein JW963_14040 [Anaerolineales bacterium]|nr:hypothetical protein [Anaerolineales bacterium]